MPGYRHRLLHQPPGAGHPVRLRQVRHRSTPPWSATSSPSRPATRCARSARSLGMPVHVIDRLAKSVSWYGYAPSQPGSRSSPASRSSTPWFSRGHVLGVPLICRQIDGFPPPRLASTTAGCSSSSCPLMRHRAAGEGDHARPRGLPVGQGQRRGRRADQDRPARPPDALACVDEALTLVERRARRGARTSTRCRRTTRRVRHAWPRRHHRRLPGGEPGADADAAAHAAALHRRHRRSRSPSSAPAPSRGTWCTRTYGAGNGQERVTYLHPKLEPILAETLGVILFQEQVIQVAVAIAGFTPGEADQLRRAMSRKRSGEAMERLRGRFMAGRRANGVRRRERRPELFASWGLRPVRLLQEPRRRPSPSSLRVRLAQALLPGRVLLRPAQPPADGLLLPGGGRGGRAKRHGVRMLPVDVNRSSGERCAVENGAVRLGFQLRAGHRRARRNALVEGRGAALPFATGLLSRAQSAGRSGPTWWGGAIDSLSSSRRDLLWALEGLTAGPRLEPGFGVSRR